MRPDAMTRWIYNALFVAALVSGPAALAAAAPSITAVDKLGPAVGVVIDVRPTSICETASLPRARCLPASDILGPHDRLANLSGLLWLLGTAGLTGKETVLVAGTPARDRDFMAGLLYLAGQSAVQVLTTPIPKAGVDLEPGEARSSTRDVVFQAPVRSEAIVLRSELLQSIRSTTPPILLDGRSESEYWGQRVRAARGGHIPGAQHVEIARLNGKTMRRLAASDSDDEGKPIVYGHGSRDGIAFLARHVSAGRDVRVYMEGWSGWASDGALPADSATYPELVRSKDSKQPPVSSSPIGIRSVVAGAVLGSLGLLVGGFLLGRRTIAGTG